MPRRSKQDAEQTAFDLLAAREAKQLTQTQVAEILCASQVSVSRWESTGRMPRIYRRVWDLHFQIAEIEAQRTQTSKGRAAVREAKEKMKESQQ